MKLRVKGIIGRKQLLAAFLVLALSVFVFFNWVYSDNAVKTSLENDEDKSYGDAQFVDAFPEGEAFFAEAKQTRQKSRDEAVMTLQQLIESDDVSPEQKSELALKTADMASAIEKEGKIENLIKAKGYEECMVYYDAERVDVIVRTNGLESEDVAKMKDIIIKEVSVPSENIAIIEVN